MSGGIGVGGEPAQIEACSLLSAQEEAVWQGLLRTHNLLSKELDTALVREHRLQLSSFEVLLQLAHAPNGVAGMSELARSVLLTPSGLSRLVDRLQEEGLICRQACPSDARMVFVVITPLGLQRLRAAVPTHVAVVRERLLSRLSPADQRQLAQLWDRLADAPQ